jgi:predicted RNA-binding protein YlqC (UPF0109 family)
MRLLLKEAMTATKCCWKFALVKATLGRVIGRRGRTAMSIRTVVRAAATRDGVNVDVDFVDN